MTPTRVFVIGLNEFNLKKLKKLDPEGLFEFHNLLDPKDIIEAEQYDIDSILKNASEELRSYPEGPDAIIGYMDFPVSTIVPILSEEFGTRATSLESLLKCEHKYWSRLEQQKAIPENIPSFKAFDPFDDEAFEKLSMPLPFWVKPIKSFASHLGFRIESKEDFEKARQKIQKNVRRIGDAFGKIVDRVELPEEMQKLNANACIAESLIGGDHQCTLEGAVHHGTVHFHGMVDSVRVPGTSVFERYEYPSELPTEVQDRMKTISRLFLKQVGYDDAAFNIEFYWDSHTDRIFFLEINTRVAQHHSDLFEKVDGVPNQKAALDVALDREPVFPKGSGDFKKAAVFFFRETEDRYVRSLPSKADIEAIEEEIPGTVVQLQVQEGIHLSELEEQDSYSYITALVYVGGDTTQELLDKKARVKERLRIDYAAPAEAAS